MTLWVQEQDLLDEGSISFIDQMIANKVGSGSAFSTVYFHITNHELSTVAVCLLVCPCSDCSSSMERSVLQVRQQNTVFGNPSCRRFKILERRRVLVPGKTSGTFARLVSPLGRVGPEKWGHIQLVYSDSWRRGAPYKWPKING